MIWNSRKEKKVENRKAAERILQALDNGKAPITWSEMDREELVETIARELTAIEKEKEHDSH